jgi:YD repeat-containing protein
MQLRCLLRCTCVPLLALAPGVAFGQSTALHLHKEASNTGGGVLQLKTAGPDSASSTLTVDLRRRPVGEYAIRAFDTASGSPNAAGVIPAGSSVSVTLWMRKTASGGSMYPRAKLRLNSASGSTVCEATGATQLTTTLAATVLNCTTPANVVMSATDRFYLWTGVAVSTAAGSGPMKVELRIEGVLNGNYDSRITVPMPASAPSISSLSPASGPVGALVSIAGANFGSMQGGSGVAFNGVAAAPTAWGANSISVPVPPGASTGEVMVTVNGLSSNGAMFTVTNPPWIGGLVTDAGVGNPLAGATVAAYAGSVRAGVTTTNAAGAYSIVSLQPGPYIVQAASAGYVTTDQQVVVPQTGQTAANFALERESAGPASFAYDALGRLIQVTNPSGQSAIYRYDAVGNILAIDRPGSSGSSPTGISGFTPFQGPIGASILISGAGFSPSPSDNIVTFNGVAASVSGGSATELVAIVPPGATTGPIGVLTPTGSATSASDFKVLSSGVGAPTIASFTPSIGVAGTAFTITGTNFETTSANNRVALNIRPADVTGATATTLTTSVPLASMGGRITLATPSGTVVSDGDFVVVPSPYAPVDVESSERIAPGESRTLGVSAAGRIGLLLFDGVAGQFASAMSTSSTWTSCQFGGQYGLTLFRPDGSIHTIVSNACGASTLMDHQTLPLTGTYTLMLDPIGSNTGSATISLYSGVDVIGTIAADGAPVPVTISTSTQNAKLTFDGIAGQVVSATVSNATFPGTCFSYAFALTLLKPDGSTLAWAPSCGGSVFMDQQTLPVSGTYTLLLDPGWTGTGTATVRLYTVSDVVGTIAADGTSVGVSITTPGQNARFSFVGTAGQVVSGLVSNATIPGNCTAYAFYLTLLRPDGSTLKSEPSCGGGVFLDRQTLPVSGTYKLVLDPGGTSTGNATLALYTVVDVVSPIAEGTRVPVTITAPGQNARFTFIGTPGQVVSGLVTNATIPGNCFSYAFHLMLLRPDGSTQKLVPSCGGGVFLDQQTLSTTGTYTLLLDPIGANIGSADVALYSAVDVTGPIVPNGPGVPVSVTAPGQNVRLTFNGTAGQVVDAWTSNNTIPGTCFSYAFLMSIVKPDGSNLVGNASCGGNISLGQRTLPVTGVYTILIDPTESRTGSLTVMLSSQ